MLPKIIKLKVGKITKFLSTKSIVYIKADNNYSLIFLEDGKSLYTSKTLKFWTEKIQDINWMRVHRSIAINDLKIDHVNLNSKAILLSNGESLIGSRRKLKGIM